MLRLLLLTFFIAAGGHAGLQMVGRADSDCRLQGKLHPLNGQPLFSCPEVLCNDASACDTQEVEFVDPLTGDEGVYYSCICGSYSPTPACYGIGTVLQTAAGRQVGFTCHNAAACALPAVNCIRVEWINWDATEPSYICNC